ncbi:MAG: IS1634 family transposase, partial [Myxococcota bacterium]
KLALGGGKYILGAKMRAGDEVTREVLTRAGRYHEVRDGLRVKEVIVGDGERRRRYVVCHNPGEEKRQREHRNHLLADLEAQLAAMETRADGKHSKRACGLLTSSRFGRYLRETAGGKLRIDRAAVAEAERYDGKWVITSNDDTLTVEDLALGNKQLMRVEQCWRQLKTGLRMRPVFHWRPWRIQAHVTISVMALLLERIAEIRAGDTWRNILAQLDTIKVVEYDRGEARIQQTSELRDDIEALLVKLGVPLPPRLHSVEPIRPPAPAPAPERAPTLAARAQHPWQGVPPGEREAARLEDLSSFQVRGTRGEGVGSQSQSRWHRGDARARPRTSLSVDGVRHELSLVVVPHKDDNLAIPESLQVLLGQRGLASLGQLTLEVVVGVRIDFLRGDVEELIGRSAS